MHRVTVKPNVELKKALTASYYNFIISFAIKFAVEV
jgi:hypothetical protein